MRFIDLFAGLGGFHRALTDLGHECVYACEIDDELRRLYSLNYPGMQTSVHSDIRTSINSVPKHDILCAGFPCQPFSKSGAQRGWDDLTRGTLFHEIAEILARHKPKFLILENVGNFERHNSGKTWKVVQATLTGLGYNIQATTHKASGGPGLLSPHHIGEPHHRERFFVVGSKEKLPDPALPVRNSITIRKLRTLLQPQRRMLKRDRDECVLGEHYVSCIDHWNRFIGKIPADLPLPSFPIWGDELDATYPFEVGTPYSMSLAALRRALSMNGNRQGGTDRSSLLETLPSYARSQTEQFPTWKVRFIRQNRSFFAQHRHTIPDTWVRDLRAFPASLRKLEWNCQGEERDLWRFVLQFRPSGLRARRFDTCPALVSLTETQIPILGPKRRYISRVEGLRLQGFPDEHRLPASRGRAFAALGNAVHVQVVRAVAEKLLR